MGAGQVTKNVGVAQDFTALTQRSFFSGSRCMNKYLTQGDQELAEFLEEEINLEKEAQVHSVLPRSKAFRRRSPAAKFPSPNSTTANSSPLNSTSTTQWRTRRPKNRKRNLPKTKISNPNRNSKST